MDPVRLYTCAMSPYAAKVHCFLLYQQLDFECCYIKPLRVKQDLPLGMRPFVSGRPDLIPAVVRKRELR